MIQEIFRALNAVASNAAALFPSPRVPSLGKRFPREGNRGQGNKAAALKAVNAISKKTANERSEYLDGIFTAGLLENKIVSAQSDIVLGLFEILVVSLTSTLSSAWLMV